MIKANSSVIPAVSYVRKSTHGETADGRQRQERSLSQQQREVERLVPPAGGKYHVLRRYEDAGRSGWKRGTGRPGFTAMLADVQARKDVRVILIDHIDRFSRDGHGQVQTDLHALRMAGVEQIVSAAQGIYDLRDENDAGGVLKLAFDILGSNSFCRTLSRRVNLNKFHSARAGKRTGGPAPFGLRTVKKTGCLEFGDPDKMKIVRRVFAECAAGRSINGIMGALTAR